MRLFYFYNLEKAIKKKPDKSKFIGFLFYNGFGLLNFNCPSVSVFRKFILKIC